MLPVLPSNNSHLLDNQRRLENNRSQKRTSSMVFRIEHLLPSSAPESSSSTASSATLLSPRELMMNEYQELSKRQRSQRCGVIAAQSISKDSRSENFSTLSLMNADTVVYGINEESMDYYVTKSEEGAICCTTSTTWIRKIKLSEDIHSYNVLIEVNSGHVGVRAVRNIPKGEELIAWFSEEISILMSIPFLTPFNIQGNSRYTCHVCHLTFQTPNPLKIHLALTCGRHSIDILWIRLHYALKATAFTQHFQQQHRPSPPLQRISPTLSLPSTTTTIGTSQQRFSAFTPISQTTTAPASRHHSNLMLLVPSPPPPANMLQQSTTSLNAAAQIEAIVSNMGTSKQGHLCIYCGKVYSRKYGLKIHIRTHTGFKPLKCKFCLRPFGDPSNLNKHVRLHLQTSTATNASGAAYKCHLCSKTLARRRDLQRHIESRHQVAQHSHP